ncbi:MAG: hypothetical protein ACXACC_11235 [Promethearchaeota archaeon]|jgi:hypothetical protein
MNKKRIGVLIGVLLIITIFTSSIGVTATTEKEPNPEPVFKYGAFVLTSKNIEGLKADDHVGGLSNLDIVALTDEFIIATFPIWGTTIIDEEVEVHITIESFLGVIQTYSCGKIQVVGICKNIAWEIQ